MNLVITALVGFGGVLIGGALAGLIELWRQLLEGRAAARILRLEIQENVNRAGLSVTHLHSGIRLKYDAWRDVRVKVAPLLPEVVLGHLATGYGALFIVEDWISKIQQKQSQAKAEIWHWAEDMMLDSAFLLQLQRRSRIAQMVDLLLGKPTFPTPARGAPGMEEQLAERKKKLMERFRGEVR